MKTLSRLSIGLMLTLATSSALAASDGELASLKASMLDMLSRIEALEAENKTLKQQASQVVVAAKPHTAKKTDKTKSTHWTDKIAMKGDVRYRYEGIDIEGRDDRSRDRIRARLQVDADVNENVKATVGFATGSEDPLSANQTIGGGGSTKRFGLNLAYLTWQVNDNTSVLIGKHKNNFFKPSSSQLLFDNDYSPEGVALNWSKGKFFAKAAYQWLESDSRTNNDEGLIGVQGGIKSNLAEGKLTAGAGFYNVDSEGLEVFRGDADDFFGNSFTCADPVNLIGCEYDESYEVAQLFAHWSGNIADLPVAFHMDYINNQATNDLDTAWGIGAVLGKASGWKTWQLGYRYQDVEEDANFGALSDSNFGGGGTGASGHIISGKLGIAKGWQVTLTYFGNKDNVIGGSDTDYDRIQLDSQFKF